MQQSWVHGNGSVAITNIQNVKVALELGNGQKIEFEKHDRNNLDCLNRLLLEIWTLNTPLVRAPKEVRNTVEKTQISLENTKIIIKRLRRIVDAKGVADKSSGRSEERCLWTT